MKDRVYIAIDLKSFYASVECVRRNLNPLETNLVVADASKTDKTICLAVSPSLKAYGISGRSRLYEVRQKVKEANHKRLIKSPYRKYEGKSINDVELKKHLNKEIDFLIVPPNMKYYMEYSSKIYSIYLKYISQDDIHIYSIDEVFMDVTSYLKTYNLNVHDLAMKIILDVLKETGITATAGIGTNLFLAKVAMDVVAKRIKADENGVRIAYLDEEKYKKEMWSHMPLEDFWRIGKGTANKLRENNMFTMGDIARMSLNNEHKLFELFGVNAELIIDHAWGYEPCLISDIKKYKPSSNSLMFAQVLSCPYTYENLKLIIKEMVDNATLDLVSKHLVTNHVTLDLGYDISCLDDYEGDISLDKYNRKVPKPSHSSINLELYTSSNDYIRDKTLVLYDKICKKNLLIRRLSLGFHNVIDRDDPKTKIEHYEEISLFETKVDNKPKIDEKEIKVQDALVKIKNKYGKNAIYKAMNLSDGATGLERNSKIGGHKA